MQKYLLLLAALCIVCEQKVSAQVNFKYDVLSASRFTNENKTLQGSGAMQRVALTCNMPWSAKTDGNDKLRSWAVTLRASYAWLDNQGDAKTFNPDRVLQAGVNLSHVRSLSSHWLLMASLGAGIYADPSEADWNSVLANGGVIFAYRINPRLSLGAGLGLTNSYGLPLILPLGYFKYNCGNRFRLTVDLATSPKISVATNPVRWMTLELTPFEIDGLTAVRHIGAKSKIYSSTLLRSSFCPTFHLRDNLHLHFTAAGTWLRSVRLTDKSLRGLKNQLSGDCEKQRFAPAFQVSAGLTLDI